MFFTRSILASATLLSFSALSDAWVLHRKADEHAEVKRVTDPSTQGGWSWNSLFPKRQGDVILDCPDNQFAALLDNNPDDSVESFCNDWLNIAPTTVFSEVTPTVTVTTSASTTTTQTNIQRILTTTTLVETATISATASIQRRMVAAAAAQVESIAASIVESVIASGTPTSVLPASSKPANRLLAEQGLATACSCKMVQPTSTVTQLYTVPAVTSTVGVRVIRVIQQTETKTTSAVSSTADAASASSTDAASSSTIAESSSSASAAGESSAAAASSSSAVSISAEEPSSSPVVTAAPVVSTIASANSTSTASDGVPIVTAIPFSCDEDDVSKDVDQVVGGIRLGYSVYCNTELVTADRIGRPINVESATSCAAQCSLLNAQSGQDTCQSAVFTAYTDGRRGGTCDLISAAESTNVETAPAPGSITIIHTGTFANGDECAALNASSVSIDTSALVASITSAGVVISTPGLVTQSSGGGVSRTYVSANSTDASGYVHWSWFELYASSASWYAVYETSWACSATITRTIEQQATTVIEGTTITSVAVTTIIGNGYTTIISGDTTTTIRGGGGSAGPTFVPASTTDGEAGVTTFFSTATQTSTGTDGIVTPAPTAVGGEGNVTVIEVFSTFFSTGTAGVIAPSVSVPLNGSVSGSITVETIVSSTATTLTISGSNSTILSTGADGVITPSVTPILETIVSSGAVTLTLSGSEATATSSGDGGVIPPPPSASASESSPVVSSLSSTTDSDEWETPGFYGPKTSTLVVVSSEVLTVTSTGLSGVETPTVITAVSSETVVVIVSNTTLSGNASIATSTSIATFNSTGGNGIITPTVVTEIITTAAGTANFTVTLATATANSTGLEGVITPGGTLVVTETANITLPLPTPTAPVISFGGSDNFTASAETAFTSSTGASGVIPPVSANSTTSTSPTGPPFNPNEGNRTGSYTRTVSSTSASGFITPSSNLTVPVGTPSANTTLVLTVPLSTGVTVTVEIPSVNSSLPITSAPSSTPAPTFNTSSSIPSTEANRTGSFSRSIPVNTISTLTLPLSTGPTTVEIIEITSSPPSESESGSTLVITATTNVTLSVPTGNVTLVTLIPPTTRPFDNTTAPLPTPTGNITVESLVSINYSTVPSFSTGNLSTILPPTTPTTNITIVVETPSVPSNSTTVPPSVTLPPVSLNSTTSASPTGPPFNPNEGNRTGSYSRPITLSTGVSSFLNATTTPPPFPTGNSTVPVGPTAPADSTTEACPSPTEFSFITREVIITTYTIETVPVVAATCISDALPTAVNGSFPTGGNTTLPTDTVPFPSVVESIASAIESLTATDSAPTSSGLPPVVSEILSAVSSIVSEVTSSTTLEVESGATAAPLSRFRRTGTLATEEQIAAACADTSNLILSPALDIQPDNSTEGWFVGPSDNTITVTSITTDNGTIAQFRSAFPGRTISLIQPLTLCPGTQYELSALTRQASRSSRCTAQFKVGNDAVFTATPQTSWISETQRFTAGAGPEGASVDLQVVGSCEGFFGAPVGADADGYMVLEVGSVSVVADALK
ncbi:hypothetical protein N0V95_008493 [Ascochyta clinopodiicola]|nr:hypothetical protein N0V95_008493 [Ascochyta clinopodiicola]